MLDRIKGASLFLEATLPARFDGPVMKYPCALFRPFELQLPLVPGVSLGWGGKNLPLDGSLLTLRGTRANTTIALGDFVALHLINETDEPKAVAIELLGNTIEGESLNALPTKIGQKSGS